MNIVVLGAGAIGSFFGALLSIDNNVVLVGRPLHVDAIKKHGLRIVGRTNVNVRPHAVCSVSEIPFMPDMLMVTVKSYDTESAVRSAKSVIGEDTLVLSLQNGLDNVDKIVRIVGCDKVIAGVTTYGAIFSRPGVIRHTGVGLTVLGELSRRESGRIKHVVYVFNRAGIRTRISMDIWREIWSKVIINSSINPVTAFFQCKNGYLLKNPVLRNIVGRICRESTLVAQAEGMDLSYNGMLHRTIRVIRDTAENYSSMLQSLRRGGRTEIDSINGRIVEIGKKHGVDTSVNEILVFLIKEMESKNVLR
ncbi:MAG: 2-dehydropantoate 2-reductase [Thermoplasmata archaeon]|nr:MAG: 2-dehydropantoate 2-reductase [Thermoplasmata archaeon]RLF36039.1 MAG: 2-dehydropantoate 2-reductase [Thermoplasmata archaeon]